MPLNPGSYRLSSVIHLLSFSDLRAKQELKVLEIVAKILASCALSIVVNSPAQAFNFTIGDVGGSCESLLTSLNPDKDLGTQKLPTCQTADGFRLIAEGGDLQAKRRDSITNVGVTDFDWSGAVGICLVGVISPCNGNTGEGEIGHREALQLLLPNDGAVLESLDLSFRFSWNTPSEVVFELAAILSDQSQETGTLTFRQDNEAIWNWAGNTQTTTSSGSKYRLSNPFFNTSIAAVKLTAPRLSGEYEHLVPVAVSVEATAPRLSGNYGYVDTKYGLIGAEARKTAHVPEPSSLLGLLLAGITGIKLRQRIGKGN